MAENITLNNIATFQNDTSAANTYNANNTAIVTAFADVLSRSGVGPNQMQSTLDMNNFQIINLPAPTTAGSPARLIDIAGGNLTINTATTGTSGHTVPFLDGNNTWSGTINSVLTDTVSTGSATNFTSTTSGTTGSNFYANQYNFTDTVNAGGNNVSALQINHAFGGNTVQGQRSSLDIAANLTSPTAGANPIRIYMGLQSIFFGLSGDGGSASTSFAASSGQLYGGILQTQCTSSAINLQINAAQANSMSMAAGSSAWAKTLLQLSASNTDAVNGTVINSMIWLNNDPSASSKWTNAILIDNQGGQGVFPVATTGTVFRVTGGTFTNGIDFTNNTLSGNPYMSNAFSVNSGGAITSGGVGLASGNLILNGITSGNATFSANATANLVTLSQPFQVGIIGTTAGTITIAGLTSGSTALSCSATGSLLQLGAGNVTIDTSGNTQMNGTLTVGTTQNAATAGGLFFQRFGNISTFGIYTGSGAPTVTAAQGSLYLRTDGSTNVTRAYINTTGSNVWTAINTVA